MGSGDLMSINTVAARLGLSVHQLRRWELMFGLEIKRGRGQQRQYRPEDLTVLERIKELVEQGWPTSQIRPQIEAEGLISPKLIGLPTPPGNPEVVLESIIGFRNFAERRFIEISRQIDELRQLVISITLKQELAGEADSPWQPVEHLEEVYEEPKPRLPAQEITLGPEATRGETGFGNLQAPQPAASSGYIGVTSGGGASSAASVPSAAISAASGATAASSSSAVPTAQPYLPENFTLGEVTDQNYLTILGRALDLIGWTDDEADAYSEETFNVPHWDELGRSQAERLVAHLVGIMKSNKPDTVGSALGGAVPPSFPDEEFEDLDDVEDMSPDAGQGGGGGAGEDDYTPPSDQPPMPHDPNYQPPA
jgi:Predicted transcriptional regulators